MGQQWDLSGKGLDEGATMLETLYAGGLELSICLIMPKISFHLFTNANDICEMKINDSIQT